MRVIWAGQRYDEHRLVTGGQRYDFEVLRYLRKANVPLLFLKNGDSSEGLISRSRMLCNLRNIHRFVTMAKTEDTILLEDYSGHVELFLLNPLVHMMGKVKLVSMLHNFYFTFRKSRLKDALDKLVSGPFLGTLDLVITPTQTVASEVTHLMNVPSSKIRVSYNAIRPEIVDNAGMHQDCKKVDSPASLLFVGYLTPRKGLEYLIESIAMLSNLDCRLSVVGDLNAYPPYTKLILDRVDALGVKDKVSFASFVSTNDLVELYRTADVFVLPSLDEGFGVVLAEAMCFGLPIVATNVGAIPELVEDGVNGILVPPKDSHALAKAIAIMVQTPGLRRELGQESYRKSFIWCKRTWDDVGRECYEALLELV